MDQCGTCHRSSPRRYFETYHGKVSKLGFLKTAKCYDCHGAHDILPASDPRSHLSRQNIVATCAQCHPGSNRRFAGYLTHATHHDPEEVPGALLRVLGHDRAARGDVRAGGAAHAGLAAALAAVPPRSSRQSHALESPMHVRRFPPLYRTLHIMVITSFIALALTGMTLKFSYTPWAYVLSRIVRRLRVGGRHPPRSAPW